MPNPDKELTVEECLAELREMFPDRTVRITHLFHQGSETDSRGLKVEVCLYGDDDYDPVDFVGQKLSEAMTQLRAWHKAHQDQQGRED